MAGVYRIEVSEHEYLESQQPVKFYQQVLIFTYLVGVETLIVFVDFLDLCAWIKSLIKTVGVLSKLEVQIQAFFLQIPLDLGFCCSLSFFHKRRNLNFLLVCYR